MLATLLFDLILTVCLGCGPYYPTLATPGSSNYAPTPCVCPKDSPCKKGCEKDACCCKDAACAYLPPAMCPYGQPCPMPTTHPNPPLPPGSPCLYEVELKVGKDASPKFLVPMGGGAFLQHLPESPKCEGTCQVGIHITDAGCGCVKVDVQLACVRPGFAGIPSMQFCKGSKTVHLDTPTNVLLSCDDPEPCSIGLFVKTIEVPTTPLPVAAEWCPCQAVHHQHPPIHYPMPPAPTSVPGFFVGNGETCCQVVPGPAGAVAVQQAAIPEPLPLCRPAVLGVNSARGVTGSVVINERNFDLNYQATPVVIQQAGAIIPEPVPLPHWQPAPTPYPVMVSHRDWEQLARRNHPIPLFTGPQATILPCSAVALVKESSARFSLVRCCHKSLVGMKCDGVVMTGVRMTIEKGACGTVTVAAGQKYVHVKGKKWKAQADSVEVRADGHIVLSGHVKLSSDQIGVCASVKAKKLCVEVKDGKFVGVGCKE